MFFNACHNFLPNGAELGIYHLDSQSVSPYGGDAFTIICVKKLKIVKSQSMVK